MKFKDLKINDIFIKPGELNTRYIKVKEERVSCCKIKLNAKTQDGKTTAVFRPLQEVVKIVEE